MEINFFPTIWARNIKENNINCEVFLHETCIVSVLLFKTAAFLETLQTVSIQFNWIEFQAEIVMLFWFELQFRSYRSQFIVFELFISFHVKAFYFMNVLFKTNCPHFLSVVVFHKIYIFFSVHLSFLLFFSIHLTSNFELQASIGYVSEFLVCSELLNLKSTRSSERDRLHWSGVCQWAFARVYFNYILIPNQINNGHEQRLKPS